MYCVSGIGKKWIFIITFDDVVPRDHMSLNK